MNKLNKKKHIIGQFGKWKTNYLKKKTNLFVINGRVPKNAPVTFFIIWYKKSKQTPNFYTDL